MFCPKCGYQLPDDSQFCSKCGAKIGTVQTAQDGAGSASSVPAPKAAANVGSSSNKLMPIIAVVAALAVLGVLLGTSVLGGDSKDSSTSVEQGSTTASSAISDNNAVVSSAEADGVSSDPDSTQGAQGNAGGSVDVKSALNDYSWEELSKISAEISAAGDEAGGIEVAKKYGLCNSDGTLDGTQLKDVTLTSGIQAQVQIVGFNHDDKSDGSGKAGISFIFKDCVAERAMNSSDTNAGGWEASEMRSWLISSFASELPSEISSIIVSVEKLTNNVGETESISSVTATSDMIWLPSTQELCGNVDWCNNQVWNDILNNEGSEYKLFRDVAVNPGDPNSILVKSYEDYSCSWWERSPYPGGSHSFQSMQHNGRQYYGELADLMERVAPGFCI